MNAREVKAEAARLGFERCGVARALRLADAANLRRFVAEGRHGTMGWLADTLEKREDIGAAYPWVKSVIVCALNYKPAQEQAPLPGRGLVARYARGEDYHRVVSKKLKALRDALRRDGARAVAVTDTGTLMEKPWAREAGVAWIGKHTNALDPRIGSWFSLGVVMTDLELEPDAPAPDHCGSCTACLDACPTQALTAYRMDASKCISYLTIEHRDAIEPALREKMGTWVFGCDLCQDACPWNREAPPAKEPAFAARPGLEQPSLGDWLVMTEAAFAALTRGTALRRARRSMLRRNAAIALGNAGDPAALPALAAVSNDPDPLVAAAARDAAAALLAHSGKK